MNRRKLGTEGERLAEKYLCSKGYSVIDKNVYVGKIGEIDLVASTETTLVFVEVKLSRSFQYGHPLYRITEKKRVRMISCAKFYLHENPTKKNIRFDVITISKKNYLTHYPDAFREE